MREEFEIQRSGKTFVLYAGLLDESHQRFDKWWEMNTELVQVPSTENGMVAVAKAHFIGEPKASTEENRKVVKASGIGDASPENVGRAIVPHIIRMAECVTVEAEILTERGWKRHHELEEFEAVLGYDVETDTLRWVPLLAVSVFEPVPTVRIHGKSFDVTCTPDHKWAVRNNRKRKLKPLSEMRGADRIIVAASLEDGDEILTPREAALVGWLATDGTVRQAYNGKYGPYLRATITQSKPEHLEEIKTLVGADGSEHVEPPRYRDFGAYTSTCLPCHKFDLASDFADSLLSEAGLLYDFTSLPQLVLTLSQEARAAMLDAMLKGDGSSRDGKRWVFGKKRKPGVMEAFEILATLQGVALGVPRFSSVGEVPIRSLRENQHIDPAYLKREDAGKQVVWCPTTELGTWIMRDPSGTITITGNTRAKARALRDAVNVGATSLEELSEDEHEAPQSQRGQPQRGAEKGAAKDAQAPPKGKRGELLKQVRDNLRLMHGDQWQDAERMIVRKSDSQKPLVQLTITELEKMLQWTEDQANKLAEEAARAQAEEAEEEFSDQEIPF